MSYLSGTLVVEPLHNPRARKNSLGLAKKTLTFGVSIRLIRPCPVPSPTVRSMKGVTVVKQYSKKKKNNKNNKTTNRHQNAMEYIAGKSFLFISFKKK